MWKQPSILIQFYMSIGFDEVVACWPTLGTLCQYVSYVWVPVPVPAMETQPFVDICPVATHSVCYVFSTRNMVIFYLLIFLFSLWIEIG
jgi:hypothetical protein